MFHPDLGLARWLPRSTVGPRRLPLWRAFEWSSDYLPSERVDFEGGGAALVYRPKNPTPGPGPGVLWIHGGGLIVGHAAINGRECQALADQLGATVYSAQYRLAPEHPYPTPLEDCFRALQHLAALPEVDANRIGVAGQSAGGGLSAAVALLARDRGVPLAAQALIYPMLDDRSSDAAHPNADHYRLWDVASNRFGWASYLAEVDPDDIPYTAVPGRLTDATGLAPAWIGVGTLDLFFDEDVRYAELLEAHGVPCELHVVDGAYHGFDAAQPGTAVSKDFFDRWVGMLRSHLVGS